MSKAEYEGGTTRTEEIIDGNTGEVLGDYTKVTATTEDIDNTTKGTK